MNKLISLLFIWLNCSLLAQTNFNGVWQGVMIPVGKNLDQGQLLYLSISNENGIVTGKTREELYATDLFSIKKCKIEVVGSKVKVKQLNIEKKKNSSKTNWCLIDFELNYIDSTGYLEGKYISSDCRGISGKIILYQSETKFSEDPNATLQNHIWFDQFKNDIKNGYHAPKVREAERKNFQFQPVYFDYDMDVIKPEYEAYLIKMIRVVNSHSDLRIKVIGNTDSDGSDIYNEDLSRRRAQAIKDFFTSHGLKEDRLRIEFNGEKNPIDSNKTPEGKQKNRRVDFEFI